MARPAPNILVEFVDGNFRSEQVIEAEAIYTVTYKGIPFNLKTSGISEATKYKKTTFCSEAHCVRLAQRLNKKFKSDDFEVVRFNMDGGEIVFTAKYRK